MNSLVALSLAAGVTLAMTVPAIARPVATQNEMAQARKWLDTSFAQPPGAGSATPFSFTYGGKPSSELLPVWKFKETTKKLTEGKTQRTQTYTDPNTGLQVRAVIVSYSDFPTLEWTLHFKNTGEADTPIVENIQALDMGLQRTKSQAEFVLHHNLGTPCTPADYQPLVTDLGAGATKRIAAAGGRPTNTDMCYFNLTWGEQGMIVALGWTGQIATSFARDSGEGIRITLGQEQTHFKLLPGEEVRTPLVALQFWQGGDLVRSQNIWRRWMIAHNLPRPGGKPMPTVFSAMATDLFANYVGTEDQEVPVIEGYPKRGLQLDYWWIDAGWYPCKGAWWNTGNWEVDASRYPNGIKAVADAAHAAGMKLMVWFEPERCTAGTWLAENHPEWILGGKGGGLVNLGHPDARNWIIERVDKLIVENDIDMYRQDFNMDPLGSWRGNDAEDRQGITEIRHVEGLYAFWDELKRRHPNMPFDNCASGGRRNDLEMMRRGVPLSKTDSCCGTTGSQAQFYGCAQWLPYFGSGGCGFEDIFKLRCNYAPWICCCWDTRSDKPNYPIIKQAIAEHKKIAPYYFGDFYPLTPYSLAENVWMAWQFDLPEKGKGLVQAFRRPESPDESATYKLQGLEPGASYELLDFDSDATQRMSGRDLMDKGLVITMKQQPWAAIVTYKKVR